MFVFGFWTESCLCLLKHFFVCCCCNYDENFADLNDRILSTKIKNVKYISFFFQYQCFEMDDDGDDEKKLVIKDPFSG